MLFGISAKITIRQDTRVGCRQGHFMEFRVIQIFNSDLVGLHILILCYGYSVGTATVPQWAILVYEKLYFFLLCFEKVMFIKTQENGFIFENIVKLKV